jgi:hypothetical protein
MNPNEDFTALKPYGPYAWPGGYPMFYISRSTNPYHPFDEDVACYECAERQYWQYMAYCLSPFDEDDNAYGYDVPDAVPIVSDIYYEGDPLECDFCADVVIESAYGPIEEEVTS